jgi:hypothetical protein
MEIPEVSSWILQHGCPCWERGAVAEANFLQRDKALGMVQEFKNQAQVPRSVLFAAGLLDSPWRCKTAEMMLQKADPNALKEPAALLCDQLPPLPLELCLWPTVPDPELERPAKRRRLLGDHQLVASYKAATPKKDPRWKELQKASGLKVHAFGRALEQEGFIAHCQHGIYAVVHVETKQWVALL